MTSLLTTIDHIRVLAMASVVIAGPVAAAPAPEPVATSSGLSPSSAASSPSPEAGEPGQTGQTVEPGQTGELGQAGETIEIVDRQPAGARSTIERELLERAEHDDLHKVLGSTAGVYVRDEDGYGLRPNIGMRGVSADRSSKITLMEDGVLIAPAPYSAPAAYYMPLVTRLSRIEVIKGPSAIRFGPSTVGGAIDLIGEPIPGARAGYVDLAAGSDRYAKLHARAAERRERWAVMDT